MVSEYSLVSEHASAYIAAMIIFLSILAYQKVVQDPGFRKAPVPPLLQCEITGKGHQVMHPCHLGLNIAPH